MKILHYIPVYAPAWQWGGPVRSVSGLCEGLAARGHEVTVFTTNAGLEENSSIVPGSATSRNGVTVHYFPRMGGYGIKSPALMEAVSRDAAGFDVIHVTAIWQRTGSAACRAARRAGVPYVISPRGALAPYSWRRGRLKKTVYYWLFERTNLRHAAGFHYTSAMEAEECGPFRFGKPSCVVPNPIDFSFWRREPEAGAVWRKQLEIGLDELVLLYAGRLHHKKGLDLLPWVLRGCVDAGMRARLVLIGADEDGTGGRLREQVTALGAARHVTMLPMQRPEELRVAYSGADVFVLPSRHENFGNVAVEAAACGCRVFMSPQVGIARELEELDAGKILPRSVDAWVQRVRDAARPSIDRRSDLTARFGTQSVAAGTERFYQQLRGDKETPSQVSAAGLVGSSSR